MRPTVSLSALLLLASTPGLHAVTAQEMAQRHKPLPTVAEKDLPAMKNQPESFSGAVKHDGLQGHTWVRFPFVENPGSFGIDRQGRIFVGEVNRFWQGVPDLRGVNEFIRGDFQSQTVEDRAKLYASIPGRFPEGFFTNTADRLVRLEDRDGNGAADHRALFSDQFHQPLDGIGFSVLPEDDAVYFTCIPSLWKLTDKNDDGVADSSEALVSGFGVRVSFIGHDLHGIIRGPDGRLYFSIGDRGYHVTTKDGRVLSGPSTGAIFRCESDGSNFEVFCKGLRNPTELAFDELGNLFTFDNTGDIGDKARMVYALEGTDSGWDMRHQSAHQYVGSLDWEEFHPTKSMWVAEKMFAPFHEEQPQWVYPPAANVARGPSGVTYVTGDAVPNDLRGHFLLADYGGAVTSCNLVDIAVKPSGAGYALESDRSIATGVGMSDVELGFDGKIYICDFGGGWSINTTGAIHTLTPTDKKLQEAGAKSAERFKVGLAKGSTDKLVVALGDPDKRMRQMAQFELVKLGTKGQAALAGVAQEKKLAVPTRLHGMWGLGQLMRQGDTSALETLIGLTRDADAEVRANAARVLGEGKGDETRARLLEMLKDESARVRSLAAISVGRVAKAGDADVIQALYELTAANAQSSVDPVLRHACLAALDRVGTVESALAHATDAQREVRLMALLYLRRQESAEMVRFLTDADAQIRTEAVRAIYDTKAVDTAAGDAIASLDLEASKLPPTVQRRVIAANYRRGTVAHAQRLMQIASNGTLEMNVREAALQALRLWEKRITADPVLGGYRPIPGDAPSMKTLGSTIGAELKQFLDSKPPQQLAALALKLADATDLVLGEATLKEQIANAKLDASVRVAALDSLVKSAPDQAREVVRARLSDGDGEVAASALRHGLTMKVDGIGEAARRAVNEAPLAAARAGLDILATLHPAEALERWTKRESSGLRRELWLDLFLALQASSDHAAKEQAGAFAATAMDAVPRLSMTGGDAKKGEVVFRNQGACLQCHKIGEEGGVQGPPLTLVAERLKPEKLVESLVNPNAEIAQGYGLSSITLEDGSLIAGRIPKEDKDSVTVVGLDNKEVTLQRAKIKAITPPMSAMPPMALSLPPRDLRDLVAFLNDRTQANMGKLKDSSSHGDDEKVAK